MRTHAEAGGREPFDWNAFLNKESYSVEELEAAAELSEQWVSCACGNQCEVIPRNIYGAPLDDELYKLGNEFDSHISDMLFYPDERDIQKAKEVLLKIEKRSMEILKEMGYE